MSMRTISKKTPKEFWERHPQAKIPLNDWYKLVSRVDYDNFASLRTDFPSADLVDNLFVFNISGNKYWLITAIHFNTHKIFIRNVLTHTEYDKGKWKK